MTSILHFPQTGKTISPGYPRSRTRVNVRENSFSWSLGTGHGDTICPEWGGLPNVLGDGSRDGRVSRSLGDPGVLARRLAPRRGSEPADDVAAQPGVLGRGDDPQELHVRRVGSLAAAGMVGRP